MNRRTILGLLASMLIVLSGCGGPAVDVGFHGGFNTSNRTFTIQGQITDAAQRGNQLDNVTVYLYTEDGRRLNCTNIESFRYESQRFTLTASDPPKYIIINSTEFWEYNNVDVDYHFRRGDEYPQRPVGSRSELPVTPGGC